MLQWFGVGKKIEISRLAPECEIAEKSGGGRDMFVLMISPIPNQSLEVRIMRA